MNENTHSDELTALCDEVGEPRRLHPTAGNNGVYFMDRPMLRLYSNSDGVVVTVAYWSFEAKNLSKIEFDR